MGKPLQGFGVLSLPLLKAWILFVDDIQPTLAANYLTVNATFLNRSSNFHVIVFNYFYYIPRRDYLL